MKRIVTLIMVWGMMMGFAQAQITHTAQGNVDKNAENVIHAAAKKLNSSCVSMKVTLVNKDTQKKETARTTAQVLYNKGKYKVVCDDQVLYCDGKAVWHWNKEVNEVMVSVLQESDMDLMNPGALLKNYESNFKAKYIRTEENGVSVVDLTPKKSKSYYKIRLMVDKNGGVKKMVQHNYDGSCGEYIVTEFKSGVKCADSDFMFDASGNKGVEIIDMR